MSPSSESRIQSGISPHISRLLRRSWSYWTGGAWVTALVAFALPVWWRTGSGAYESYVVLEAKSQEAVRREAAAREKQVSGASDVLADLKLLQNLDEAPSYRADPEAKSLTMSLAPAAIAINAIGAQRFELTCRASSPRQAQQRCETLTRTALSLGNAFHLIEAPTLPEQPVSVSRGAVVLTATGIGVLSGMLWMLACALLLKEPKTHKEVAPRPMPVPSSMPPPKPFSSQPPPLQVTSIAPSAQGTAPQNLAELCRQVYQLATHGSFLIGVSSWPQDREHKSRVAAQLAWALSNERNARVLLLEADFEAPAVDRVVDVVMPPLSGFSQQMFLRGEHESHTPWMVVQCGPSLSVLAEGRLRTPGLPKPERLIEATGELRKRFDIIIADGPVARRSVDVRLLSSFADGVVFVAGDQGVIAETAPSLSKWFPGKKLLSIVAPETSA